MRTPSLVLAAVAVVYCGTSITLLAGQSEPQAPLPANVQDMRATILAAVHSGKLEDLAPAIEQNELPPEFGATDKAGRALAQLKSLSADGSGRDLLAVLGNVLETQPAKLPIGRDAENNSVYVWPGLSERPLDQLTPAEHVALLKLMPLEDAKAMIEHKKWTWWRLAIGADGTWLTFLKPVPKPAASK